MGRRLGKIVHWGFVSRGCSKYKKTLDAVESLEMTHVASIIQHRSSLGLFDVFALTRFINRLVTTRAA